MTRELEKEREMARERTGRPWSERWRE
jgi:hypothetical protein